MRCGAYINDRGIRHNKRASAARVRNALGRRNIDGGSTEAYIVVRWCVGMATTLGGHAITLGSQGGSGCSVIRVFLVGAIARADGGVIFIVLWCDIALKTIVIGGDRSIGLIEI